MQRLRKVKWHSMCMFGGKWYLLYLKQRVEDESGKVQFSCRVYPAEQFKNCPLKQ